MKETTNLKLKLYDTADAPNLVAGYNASMEAIDKASAEWGTSDIPANIVAALETLKTQIGELQTQIAAKANAADVYTKTAADGKFALKTDIPDVSSFITKTAADAAYQAKGSYATTATVTALTSTLTGTPSGNHPGIDVSFDTILPVLGRTAKAVKVAVPGAGPAYLPSGDVVVRAQGEQPPEPTVEDVIATGERFLGLRYLWAGVSAWGFDCSGYTYTLFHHHGLQIGRDAGDQMNHSGLAEVAREDLRRGDLVFFATEPGGDSIRHVALYLGDDLIMQAPNAERSVEIMSLTEYDPTGEYAGARRVLES